MKARKKPFIAVIGGRKAGKSTVIQSLTGCPGRNFRGEVREPATNQTIHVIASSPQENPLSRSELRAALRQAANDANCRGFVIALQPAYRGKNIRMKEVFQEVSKIQQFDLVGFVIDPPYNPTPSNLGVAAVRGQLLPLNTKLKKLDGRRFVHSNARRVSDLTGLTK